MLTKDQEMEIKRLKQEAQNVSQIAARMKLDWKTVKKVLSQDAGGKSEIIKNLEDTPDENELVRLIFSKLNAGVSPEEIVAEVGHVDLVTSLHEKWKALRRYNPLNPQLPDPRIVRTPVKWEESTEKYPDWHLKKAMKAVSQSAYLRMTNCRNHKNKNVECPQLYGEDPYWCISCLAYKLDDV
jgi:hypothetical protein